MVVGVDRFKSHFDGHEHQYVLIGGAACDLIMDEVGLDFRATKDLDVVLIVEALDTAFSERFWAFVEAGAYEIRQSSEGKRTLYRFQKPREKDFPAMIELFSRNPEGLTVAAESHLTPLPISEEAASLSAILLDDHYYEFLKGMVRSVGGIPVLDEGAIIPFKARAWLDLSKRRDAGESIDSRNVTKHRNDVARLVQLIRPQASYALSDGPRADMGAFINEIENDEEYDPRRFKVDLTKELLIEHLRTAYGL